MRKSLLFVLGLVLVSCSVIFGEEAEKKAPEPEGDKGFSMSGLMGSVTLDGKTWNEISIAPELSLGKFGVGLNLTIRFNEEDGLREEDWKGDRWSQIIEYLRWGWKDVSNLYILAGGLKNVSLGHGTIIGRFTNRLDVSYRKVGLETSVNIGRIVNKEWNFGIEAIANDVVNPRIVGMRGFVTPLAFLPGLKSIPVLGELKLGGSAAFDLMYPSTATTQYLRGAKVTYTDQNGVVRDAYDIGGQLVYNYNRDVNVRGTEKMSVLGGDAELPIVNKSLFTMNLYGDFVMMSPGEKLKKDIIHEASLAPGTTITHSFSKLADEKEGQGLIYGLQGTIVKKLWYKFERKQLSKYFVTPFFDTFYENDSLGQKFLSGTDKLTLLTLVDKEMLGWFGQLGWNQEGFFNVSGFYEDYDGEETKPWLHFELEIDKKLTKEKMTLKAYYDKKNIQDSADIIKIQNNAVLTADVSYALSDAVDLSIIYRQAFDSEGNSSKSTSFNTRLKF